jgi:hypothetical protein
MRLALAACLSVVLSTACTHLEPLSEARSALEDDAALGQLYQSTRARYQSQFADPQFRANIPAFRQTGLIKFSDNTVYMGDFLAWQAYLTMADGPSTLPAIEATLDHLLDNLVVPTTLPGTTIENTGYFVRDDVTQSTMTIAGTAYAVASDAQNGSDADMSQDQLIHVLFGYAALADALTGRPEPEAAQVLTRIKAHADDIALRLNAYGYMIVTPSGAPAKRGNDARAFAWPLATTVSRLTGAPLSRYLTGLTLGKDEGGKDIVVSANDLRDLFYAALDGLTAGVCDIQVGKEKQYLCNRFTLALVNSLYVSSGTYAVKPAYVERMDQDGDYLRGLIVRKALGAKVQKAYVEALQSAEAGAFTDATSASLWCSQSRWIFMPSSCPEDGADPANPQQFEGLDFLSLYDAIRAP